MTVRNPAVLNNSDNIIAVFKYTIAEGVSNWSYTLHGKSFITPAGRRMVVGSEPSAEKEVTAIEIRKVP